jgi:NAD+ diphosphatase
MSELPLAGAHIDRAAHHRSDEAWLQAAWRNGASRAIVVDGGRALVADDRLVWTPTAAAPAGERFFLGVPGGEVPGAAFFAVAAGLPDESPGGARAASLRDVGADLSAADAGLLAQAAALEQWHARHRYCHLCGTPTVVAMGGHIRRCPTDGSEHYPRTDPAVIMLVTDADDRALLGHQATWHEGRMSTLAGYVEAGETLEQAVAREVAEEVGIAVDGLRYVGSQPWPFPASLMLAFTARATSTTIAVDGVEISAAAWFSRDELAAAVAAGTVRLPMRASVAFYLINSWFGGGLAARVP